LITHQKLDLFEMNVKRRLIERLELELRPRWLDINELDYEWPMATNICYGCGSSSSMGVKHEHKTDCVWQETRKLLGLSIELEL